jgi:UDP-N-acetylglucosamine pyrophosphorylase
VRPCLANANGKLNQLPTGNDNILINLIYTSGSAAELKASGAKQVTVMLELSDLKNK